MRALDIDVPDALAARWSGWFAPARRPLVAPADLAARLGLPDERAGLLAEERDALGLYGLAPDDAVVRLDRAAYQALAPALRAELTARQPERPRWPDAGTDARSGSRAEARLVRWVEDGCRPSRHDDVPDTVWERAATAGLPRARALAGRFPERSGPNCFGTVMGAAGVAGAEHEWMQRAPFERWLAERARPLPRGPRHDGDAGVVLVWRTPGGQVEHAAVTLGDGWALHKRSQCWFSPVKALAVDGVKAGGRAPGRRLERYRIVAG
ncbi:MULTISPECIES: hypothetical protein [unclassified Isoptericola]|uniref:hypothetical protein n=1 Tax=unclassified Isoptericola TaxID=2623355 RepID=UPI0036664F3D